MAIMATLGLAGIMAMFTGLHTTTATRDINRVDSLLRTGAERLQDPDAPYKIRAGCLGTSTYEPLSAGDLPDGYTAAVTVRFWGGAPTTPTASLSPSFTPNCPTFASDDAGLQRITLTLSPPSGSPRSITVDKRQP